jgi:hypothetical protein
LPAEHIVRNHYGDRCIEGDDIRSYWPRRRNIRAFEAATGVTVVIDDTPNAVVFQALILSGAKLPEKRCNG